MKYKQQRKYNIVMPIIYLALINLEKHTIDRVTILYHQAEK